MIRSPCEVTFHRFYRKGGWESRKSVEWNNTQSELCLRKSSMETTVELGLQGRKLRKRGVHVQSDKRSHVREGQVWAQIRSRASKEGAHFRATERSNTEATEADQLELSQRKKWAETSVVQNFWRAVCNMSQSIRWRSHLTQQTHFGNLTSRDGSTMWSCFLSKSQFSIL